MNRRYDIDWLRTIAIGLLLIYHVAIAFQPWGMLIGFITYAESWPSLWLPMSMLNVWRIPLLFFVSGMGVYFAMMERTWKQLMGERSMRILLPYVFGMFFIFPISLLIYQHYYHLKIAYSINAGHLWFLGNIFVYVLLLSPLFYLLRGHENGKFVSALKNVLRSPLGLVPFVALFIVEALVLKPAPYELYAMTLHGFVLGLLAFFSGFCFVLCGDAFWDMIVRWRWLFLLIACVLFIIRAFVLTAENPVYYLVIESNCWIFSVLAFCSKYLNRNSRALTYLSEAAYPVYILHMIFLFAGSWMIFQWRLPVWIAFILLLLFTVAGCFASFEIIRRVRILRPLFGMKLDRRK